LTRYAREPYSPAGLQGEKAARQLWLRHSGRVVARLEFTRLLGVLPQG
jgi:hypothetical protein